MARATGFSELRAARKKMEDAERAFRAQVVAAYTTRGEATVDHVAEAAGLSRQRIYQIVKESEDA